MKKYVYIYMILLVLLLIVLTGCKEGNVNGLWNGSAVANEYDDKEWKRVYCEVVDSWMNGTIDPDCDISTLRFALVYINEDEMPELVVSGERWLYLYTYCPGSVASGVSDVNVLMEDWCWGTNSNTGYFYLPSENIIQNSNSNLNRYMVKYFHMNDNLAMEDWYQTWCDITVTETDSIYTYFYNGPEVLESSDETESETESIEQEDTSTEEEEEKGYAVKKIEKELTEEEWILYNFPEGGFIFLQGKMTDVEIKEEIESCFVSVQGAPVFVGLQPIYYEPENDSVHRHNYYDMICLLEEKLPKHAINSDETAGNVEIISVAEGDIGNDGKKDMAVILQSYDPAVSGWTDYGRYAYTVCIFTKADGTYKCTAINHNVVTTVEEYFDPEKYLYGLNITEEGELEVSYTIKDGDAWETINYFFVLKGNSLILCRVETEYSSKASGCGKRVIQNLLTGEVKGVAYSDLKDSFESYDLYEGTCETVTTTFDKMTRWQIPTIDENAMIWNEGCRGYEYRALLLDDYLVEKEPIEGEEIVELEPWKKAYLTLLQAIVLEKTDVSNKELAYRLIYIDEDEIPELVVSQNGYFVWVFTYAPEGEYEDIKGVNVILEECGYGAMGNVGYYYLPKDNIIYNYNSDYAGAAGTTWYGYINENHQLDSKYTIYFEDIDMQDDSTECKYYFNGREISHDLYNTYQVDGNFKFIEGNKKAYEIVEDIVGL